MNKIPVLGESWTILIWDKAKYRIIVRAITAASNSTPRPRLLPAESCPLFSDTNNEKGQGWQRTSSSKDISWNTREKSFGSVMYFQFYFG